MNLLYLIACGGRSESTFTPINITQDVPSDPQTSPTTDTADPNFRLAINLFLSCEGLSEYDCPTTQSGGVDTACQESMRRSITARENLVAADLPAGKTIADLENGTVPFYYIYNGITDYDLNLILGVMIFNGTDEDIVEILRDGDFRVNLDERGIASLICDGWELTPTDWIILNKTDLIISYGTASNVTGSESSSTHAFCDRETQEGIDLQINGQSYSPETHNVESTCDALEDYQFNLIGSSYDLVQMLTELDPENSSMYPIAFYYNGAGQWYVFL